MAAEPVASETEEIMVASVPSDATYAGTIYRNGGTVSLGRVTLTNNSKLYVYLPKNNKLDLYQGTITFFILSLVLFITSKKFPTTFLLSFLPHNTPCCK